MKKRFYHHLVTIDDVLDELESLDINDKEKMHLSMMIDSTVHHTVIDVVLTELHEDDKKTFIYHLSRDNHDEAWDFVKLSVADIEVKILSSVSTLKRELIDEIKKVVFN